MIPHKNYTVSEIKVGDYVLQINGNSYLIGEFIYQLLNKNLLVSDEKELYKYLYDNYEGLSEDNLKGIIQDTIIPLFENGVSNDNNNPVKSLIKILKPKNFTSLLNKLTFLYNKDVFWSAILILLSINVAYLFLFDYSLTLNQTKDPLHWLYIFLFTIIVIFIHEFGHVISAYKYGVLAKEIGFGFYFVYPAFYTNLTEIWRLDKYKRTVINLAGIYMQLYIGIILIIMTYVDSANLNLYKDMFYSNLFIIFFNINPLFKFDGYWIFSDWFEIYNLRSSSQKVILNIFCKSEFPKIKQNKKLILIAYSLLYSVFMLFIWFVLFRYLIKSSEYLYNILFVTEIYNFDIDLFKRIIGFTVTLYLSLRIILTNTKALKRLI